MCDITDFGCWFNSLGEWVYQLLYGIVKPFFDLIGYLLNGFMAILSEFIGFISDIYNLLFITVMYFLNNTLFLILPPEWVAVISVGITIVVLLRIYSFVKDIEILGFKI